MTIRQGGTFALDTRWTTLKKYWLSGRKRRATSASFLLGKGGRFRFVHPGPELHPGDEVCNLTPERCNRDYEDMERAIKLLLTEKSEAAPVKEK